MTRLLQAIASDAVIDRAYAWLCVRRKNAPDHADVWHLRFHWATERPRLVAELLGGTYRFAPVRVRRSADGLVTHWAARDALVLKAMALVLQEELKPGLSMDCYHLAGRGGLKGAVRAVRDAVGDARFVYRSDVQGFYASIDHGCLLAEVRGLVADEGVIDLLQQWLEHLVDEDGVLRVVTRGISLGCALSPLMSGLYLRQLDAAMADTGLRYVRFMDDWVVLAPSRWSLRRAIRAARRVLGRLRVCPHPGKTYVGYVARGFDFLGYRFDDTVAVSGLGVAPATVVRCQERVARLYERGADSGRIGQYVRRWLRWLEAGVGGAGVRREVMRWIGDGVGGGLALAG